MFKKPFVFLNLFFFSEKILKAGARGCQSFRVFVEKHECEYNHPHASVGLFKRHVKASWMRLSSLDVLVETPVFFYELAVTQSNRYTWCDKK